MALTKEQIAAAEAKLARSEALKAKRAAEREKLEGESKADAFRRIATRRTNNTLDALATLENVFDAANYDFTQTQADRITSAIETGLAKVKARAAGQGRTKSGFELGDEAPTPTTEEAPKTE